MLVMTGTIATPESVLREHADAIKNLGKRTVENVIEIGRLLDEVKNIVGHGGFLPWVDRELGWSERAVRNFIRIHKFAQTPLGKSANFADLGIHVSDLYLLAAPSTPEEVRVEVLASAQAGKVVNRAQITKAIAARRAAEKSQADIDRDSAASQSQADINLAASQADIDRDSAPPEQQEEPADRNPGQEEPADRNSDSTPELKPNVMQAIRIVKNVLQQFSPADQETIIAACATPESRSLH